MFCAYSRNDSNDYELIIRYGCGSHSFNNLCLDFGMMEVPKQATKEAVFVVKGIRGTHRVYNLYRMLVPSEVRMKECGLTLSKSRWGSIRAMFFVIGVAKPALCILPHKAPLVEPGAIVLDEVLRNMLTNVTVWKRWGPWMVF